MKTVNINGFPFSYYTKTEITEIEDNNMEQLHKDIYHFANHISEILNIKCPDIGFSEQIIVPDSTGGISVQGAEMYTPKDISDLDNCLIVLSLQDFDFSRIVGTLAHEMRHIWQYNFNSEINQFHAIGFSDSLIHPAEIDADGFAIWYMSKFPDISFEQAASLLCPLEESDYKDAFIARKNKAMELKKEFENNSRKDSILSKFIKIMKGKARQ